LPQSCATCRISGANRSVVRRALALHDGGDALQAHAGVDGRPRQRRHRAAGVAVELHEDEVPDLEPPIALARGTEALAPSRDFRARQIVTLVEVDLRAGAARSRVAHRPEVVLLAETQDAVVGKAGDRPPEIERLVVVGEDGGPQPALVDAEVLGEELPRERDGVGLEVVAEREVAEHLEERVMPGGAADVLQIVVLATRAHALLARRGAHVVAPLLAQEHALELHHAGVGEEQRLVAHGHERRRRHARVPVPLEVLEESFADLGAGHKTVIVPSGTCPIRTRGGISPPRKARRYRLTYAGGALR